jgi:hypothetical protein
MKMQVVVVARGAKTASPHEEAAAPTRIVSARPGRVHRQFDDRGSSLPDRAGKDYRTLRLTGS